jgi:acyl dehydratase
MANRDAQGRVGTAYPVEIERGKIIEFADATKSTNPAYRQQDAPVVPPTFLTTQLFRQKWAGADADPWTSVEPNQQRGMHAEQDYVFHGSPPGAGTDFVRYQGASGDMNPLHHDESFAPAAGYGAPLAVGMFNAGLLATYATDWLDAEAVRRFRITFRERVWPDDTLTCAATAPREYDVDGAPMVDVELVCTRQTGGVAVQVRATFAREEAA